MKHSLSFEVREVTAGVNGPAPISSHSQLSFRTQLFLKRRRGTAVKWPRLILNTSETMWTRDRLGEEINALPGLLQ